MPKLTHFMEAWRHADKKKRDWINPKWRLLVILATMAGVLLVREYLENKYLAEFSLTPFPVYIVLDKVLYWFLTGIVVGAAAAWLMHEGELAIGLWKALRGFEKKAEHEVARGLGMAKSRKNAAKRKRK